MTSDQQTPIPYVEALSSQFAQLERDVSRRSKVRSTLPRLHAPRTARGAVLAVILVLASVSGAAAATGTLSGLFSDAHHAALTQIVRQTSPGRTLDVSAYRNGNLFCLHVVEPDGEAGYSDSCANLKLAPYNATSGVLGVMLQQQRASGTTIAGVTSNDAHSVAVEEPTGALLAQATVNALPADLGVSPRLGTFVIQIRPEATAQRLVARDARGSVVSAVALTTGTADSQSHKTAPSAASARSYEQRYAAFARPAKARDKLPPQARGTITDGAARHFQVDPRDTRQLAANPPALGPGSAVYMARGVSGSCLIVTDPGGSSGGCSDTATFLNGTAPPIALLADGNGEWNVIAVLPNASSNVTATPNGVRVSLTLDGNVATGHFANAPTSVSWTLADGTTHSHAFPIVGVVGG